MPYKKGDFIGQKYEVFDILGEGGCGIVYLVYDNRLDHFYALKTFKGDNEIVKDRFRKEAQVWVDLDKHPYLVKAIWVDEISGRLFIAMDWIAPEEEGSPNSLDAYLKHRPPDLPQSLRWAIQFCYGMEYAYSKGIKAHRDIKPANIMIDHNKTVKISDFGLAGIATPEEMGQKYVATNLLQTMIGTSMGTPAYMPPEQFINAIACDERSDIYSFGIVLYQMASGGRLPFYADNPDYFWSALQHLHSEAQVPKLDSLLFPLIQRCLEKDPRKRYQSFKDLRTDLDVILKRLTGEVVTLPKREGMDSSEWNNKGVSLNSLRKYQEAIACFDKAINIDPLNSGAWNNKGTSLRLLGRKREALNCCEKAIKINPENARAWANKGALFSEIDQLNDALECLNQALDIKPVDLYLISQIGGMLSMFTPADIRALCRKIVSLNLTPYNRDGLYNLGLFYLQLEDVENALSLFLKAEKLDASDSGVWYELMNIYFKKQNAQKVIYYADKLINSSNYLEEAVNKKSRVLFYTGNTERALELLTLTLKSNPEWDFLWFSLSDIYEQAGRYSESLSAIKKCLDILRKNPETNNRQIQNAIQKMQGLHKLINGQY